jgi:NADH-quinone oxidoreductase subunit J
MTVTPELVAFFLLAIVAIGAALGMLFSRNAIHSALFLVLNFAVVSVFYLLLNAPFIALVQVAVYAGAIMVLFLFVIMLLGAELLRSRSTVLPWQPPLALFLGILFVLTLGYVAVTQWVGSPQALPEEVARDFGSPHSVGMLLYTAYLLPFELTSLLLLVAMIGAVLLTRERRGQSVGLPAGRAAETTAPVAASEPQTGGD